MPQETEQSSSNLEFALWGSQVGFCKNIMKISSKKRTSIRQAWIHIWTQPLIGSVTLGKLFKLPNLHEKLMYAYSETNKTYTR